MMIYPYISEIETNVPNEILENVRYNKIYLYYMYTDWFLGIRST